MKNTRGSTLLPIYERAYSALNRMITFRLSAQRAHNIVIALLRRLDDSPAAIRLARRLHASTFDSQSVAVGGTQLSHPLILAAGLVKGDGFQCEESAIESAEDPGKNILPGWRFMPALVGPVEFGSFTRHPRLGNGGTVVWRHTKSRSTQNRIGLRNPGARAAASFLGQRKDQLPAEFGINIAPSPGLSDAETGTQEVVESLEFFLDAGIIPSWFTLNLSCPNTDDDPLNHQLEDETRRYCSAFIDCLRSRALATPLWVKISPGLAPAQYRALIRVFQETGVAAVIATNTLPNPSPADPSQVAGAGGGELFPSAFDSVRILLAEKETNGYAIDVIACGGIIDGASFREYQRLGTKAGQYWSAIVYRGPLAAAVIESELARHEFEFEGVHRESLA